MLSSKDLIGIFYDSRLDILFFPFVTISCVHPSLWIYITMIVIYLESYTRERSYISSWYPYSFMSTVSFSFYIFGGSVEAFVVWVRVLPLCILVHSCLVKIVVLVLVLTSLLFPIFIMGCHKLWFLVCY